MKTTPATEQASKIAELRARLKVAEEAQETLRAIYSGEVDALVVQCPDGPRLFTLQGVDAESNRFRGEILAQVSDAVIAVDNELRVTYFNAAAERKYGVAAAEALGRCLDEIYDFRWIRSEDAAASGAALRETGQWRGENIHIKRNGESVHVESLVSCLRAGDGTQTGMLAVIRDVTERKRAEEVLRYQAELLDKVSDAIVSTDASFRVQTWNKAAERIYGWKAEEVLGREADELFHTEFVEPGREEAAQQLAATGAVKTETIHQDRNGRRRFIRSNVNLLKNAQGDVTGTVGVLRDVTERKLAEEALAAAHRETQNIIDNTTGLVYAFDLEGRFVLANAAVAKLLNSTPAQMIGKRRHDFMPQADAEWHQANDRRAIEAGRALDFEEQSELPGRSITWLTTKFPLRDAEGNIYAVGGFSTDITERKRTEQALREAQAILQDYAENLEKTVAERTSELRVRTAERERLQQELLTISEREKLLISQELHDGLCQNLAGTSMMVSMLARGLAARGDKDAESAKQICTLLNGSVNEARNLSHGLHPVGPEGEGLMNALANLAGTVTNLFHIRCPDPVSLENETASTHLFRIAQEAINNARKHGEADELRISLTSAVEGITLTIEDNGVGIPNELGKKRGMGLKSMGYRATEIGATLSVQRGDEKGTVVSCILPTCKNAR